MAIEKDFTDKSGVDHTKSYFRVAGIFIHREGTERVEIGMAAYPNKAASDALKQPLQGSTFGVAVTDEEWMALQGKDEVAKSYNFAKARKPKMKADDYRCRRRRVERYINENHIAAGS